MAGYILRSGIAGLEKNVHFAMLAGVIQCCGFVLL